MTTGGRSKFTWPLPPDYERQIHERLLRREALATDFVSNELVTTLQRIVISTSSRTAEPAEVSDAVSNAILEYVKRPTIFNPDKGTLSKFLIESARMDLWNLVQKRCRRERYERTFDESSEAADETEGSGVTPQSRAFLKESIRGFKSFVGEIERRFQLIELKRDAKRRLNSIDYRFFEHILRGEDRTEVLSRCLGTQSLPVEIQEREVKRARDRIIVALRRMVRMKGQHANG